MRFNQRLGELFARLIAIGRAPLAAAGASIAVVFLGLGSYLLGHQACVAATDSTKFILPFSLGLTGEAGYLVALATGGTERLSFLPELPTLIESGFPGLEVISWIAVLGPKSMSPALAERISRDVNRVTQSKAYREALQQRGSDARTSTPQALAERMRANPIVGRVLEKLAGVFLIGFGIKLALSK